MPNWASRVISQIQQNLVFTASGDQEHPSLVHLRNELRDHPPTNGLFADLLQDLCDLKRIPDTLRTSLVTCMLFWLDRYVDLGVRRQEISWIGVFRASMQLYADDPQRTDPNSDYGCASSTIIIWEHAKARLYDQGAIHVCAERGNDKLLHLVLSELEAREQDQAHRMEILFQGSFGGTLTALGMAIRRRHDLCVHTILTRTSESFMAEHLKRTRNLLTNEGFDETLLHQVLRWTILDLREQRISREELVDGLHKVGKVLQKIIPSSPQLLVDRNGNGDPPYKVAIEIGQSCRNRFPGGDQFDEIEKLLRDEIFASLGKKPEDVMQALYSETGESIVYLRETRAPGDCVLTL
jgi:hypothetical protein